jgi:hypothetical protein
MAKIAELPNHNSKSDQNLKNFILTKSSQPTALLRYNPFEQDAWYVKHIGQVSSARNFIYFAKPEFIPKSSSRKHNDLFHAAIPIHMRLSKPFIDFAKAVLISLNDSNPTCALHLRIVPLRYLEGVLLKNTGSNNPTVINKSILDSTVYLFQKNYGMSAAYSYASQLQLIYKHMVEMNLVAEPIIWRSPLPPQEKRRARVGKKFDDERAKKLPSAAGINALAEIFNNDPKDPAAIFGSSACALMLCAPERASEVLCAPLNLISPDWTDPETGDVGTGLRWYPAKGGTPLVKTVIPSMRDVAITAVERLTRLSAPAREAAHWYENNPNRIFLSGDLEYLRGNSTLTTAEVFAVLFGSTVRSLAPTESQRIAKWLKSNNINQSNNLPNRKKYSFAAIEQAVIKLLPPDFPIMDSRTGMRYSEALCIVRECEFRSSTPFSCIFKNVAFSTLAHTLKSSGKNRSLFDKFNYREESGKLIQMTTHQFRHYLDTLVRHSSGLSEEEISQWAGRKKTGQNATYNHESDRDLIVKLRDALGDPAKAIGPFGDISQRNFITRDQFANIKIITAHTSEHGYCIHDYAQSPCQAHQNCTDCDEHLCIKGDARAERNLRASHRELLILQEEAHKAFTAEVLGSAEWFKYQNRELERISELLAIIDDPIVPVGAVIQLLSGQNTSDKRIKDDLNKNKEKRLVYSENIESMNDVELLLKGKSDD